MANYDPNEVLSWDAEISDDGQEFVVLPEGDYPFRITGFERKQYNGSAKMPPCPEADLTLDVYSSDGRVAHVRDRLFLARKSEWRISELFRSIGQKKHGQALRPSWNKVLGAEGMVKIGIRQYTTKDGSQRTANEVRRYLDPPDGSAQPAAAQTRPAPAPTAKTAQTPAQPSWKAGQF